MLAEAEAKVSQLKRKAGAEGSSTAIDSSKSKKTSNKTESSGTKKKPKTSKPAPSMLSFDDEE